jgi:hypothetical protein
MHRELDPEFAAVSERGFRTPVANIARVTAILERSHDPEVRQALLFAQRAWIQLDQHNPASNLVILLGTPSPRIYKGGQGYLDRQRTSTPEAIQTTIQDVGYYAHRGSNLSKPCVPYTFEFLISASPNLNLPPRVYPSVGSW